MPKIFLGPQKGPHCGLKLLTFSLVPSLLSLFCLIAFWKSYSDLIVSHDFHPLTFDRQYADVDLQPISLPIMRETTSQDVISMALKRFGLEVSIRISLNNWKI